MSTTNIPKERWEEFANEYFQRKVEANKEVWSAKEWFLEGVRYGRDQEYITNNSQAKAEKVYSTQDEFKAKYGEYGENYKPQTDPKIPWDPVWDIQ